MQPDQIAEYVAVRDWLTEAENAPGDPTRTSPLRRAMVANRLAVLLRGPR